jgi:hypothetical protein
MKRENETSFFKKCSSLHPSTRFLWDPWMPGGGMEWRDGAHPSIPPRGGEQSLFLFSLSVVQIKKRSQTLRALRSGATRFFKNDLSTFERSARFLWVN